METVGDNPQAIVFSEWAMAEENEIIRRDFTFQKLLNNQPADENSLFAELGDKAFIPEPINEYTYKHYLRIAEIENK